MTRDYKSFPTKEFVENIWNESYTLSKSVGNETLRLYFWWPFFVYFYICLYLENTLVLSL